MNDTSVSYIVLGVGIIFTIYLACKLCLSDPKFYWSSWPGYKRYLRTKYKYNK